MGDTIVNYFKGTEITTADLFDALQAVGITQGDILCIHTDISGFGTPAIKDKNAYLDAILSTIREAAGEGGCIVMPTFTYSFCNQQEFNVQQTPSQMGALTERFRKQQGTRRTRDPIFSFAVDGKNSDPILETDNNCFGDQSVYAKLHRLNAKLILLGSRVKGYTFFHYIEQCFGVPYRFFKTFRGTVIDEGTRYETSVEYYVRYLDRQSAPDIKKIAGFLEANNNFKEVRFAYGSIVSIDLKQFFDDVTRKLQQDVMYFVK
jgi:aminoglycoside 3-N-acetyltransferase